MEIEKINSTSPAHKNVLILTTQEYPAHSATANHMQRIASGLLSVGANVTIVSPRIAAGTDVVEGRDALGISYRSCPLPRKLRGVPFYPYWIRVLRKHIVPLLHEVLSRETFDAVIAEGGSWYVLDAARKVAQARGVAFIPYPVEWFNFAWRRVTNFSLIDQMLYRNWTMTKSDGLIGISRLWMDIAGKAKLPGVVIPAFNKFPDGRLPPVRPSRNAAFRILFIGKLASRECVPTVIEALSFAEKQGVNAELRIIGRVGTRADERPTLRFMDHHPELMKRVNFSGWLDDLAMEDELASADAFVLLRPQDRETRALFPTRLPEYLAYGKPLIVSDAGDLAIYLQHGKSAWIVPPDADPAQVADAIVSLATNPGLCRVIGEGGRQALEQQFSQTLLAGRISDFIDELTVRRKESPR